MIKVPCFYERAMMKILQTTLVAAVIVLTGSIQVSAQERPAEGSELFIAKKMHQIEESRKAHRNILLVDQSALELRERNELVKQAALAAGWLTAMPVLYSVMEKPEKFGDAVWGSLKFVFGVWMIGGVLSITYEPLIQFIVSAYCRVMGSSIVDKQQFLHKDILIEFIKSWNEFKPHIPLFLHQQFDDVYLLYLQQGADLILNDEQAAYLINGIIMNCIQEHNRVLNVEVA